MDSAAGGGVGAPARGGGTAGAATAARARIDGLDAARGLAVVGMIIAHTHVAWTYASDASGPGQWLATMSHGRSAMLFAFCAGMSLAILTGWPQPRTGQAAVTARLRVLVRAAMLLAIAAPLVALGTQVYVILAFYAAWFVLALPVARWSARRLLALAGGLALLGPQFAWAAVALEVVTDVEFAPDANGFATETLLTGVYPGAFYLPAVLAGMAFLRADPRLRRTRLWALGLGTAGAVLGYGTGNLLLPAIAPDVAAASPDVTYTDGFFTDPTFLLTSFPHANTTPELLGSGGVVAVVTALLLSAPRGVLVALTPLRAVGALTLTSYSGHLVVLWLFPGLVGTASAGATAIFVLVVVGACWAWWAWRGTGPLEALVRDVATAATRPPEGRVAARPQ